jgi:hypothetical protein
MTSLLFEYRYTWSEEKESLDKEGRREGYRFVWANPKLVTAGKDRIKT